MTKFEIDFETSKASGIKLSIGSTGPRAKAHRRPRRSWRSARRASRQAARHADVRASSRPREASSTKVTAPAAGEQAADRCVVAHVSGDAEEHDLLRVEQREQTVGVRVREDVEALLQQEKLAPPKPRPGRRPSSRAAPGRPAASRATCIAPGVPRRQCGGYEVDEVGLGRDLGIGQLVVVGATRHAGCPRARAASTSAPSPGAPARRRRRPASRPARTKSTCVSTSQRTRFT